MGNVWNVTRKRKRWTSLNFYVYARLSCPQLIFLKKFTCVLKYARKFYVRSHGKNTCQSASQSVVWVVLACANMWSNPYKTETMWERCCVVFCSAVFFCDVGSIWLFSLVTKLSKVCQIHTFAVIFVVAVVDCLDLNSFSYIHLSCLQL